MKPCAFDGVYQPSLLDTFPRGDVLLLSYFYGHAEMRRNPLLMERLIRNLGENVWDRSDIDLERVSFLPPLPLPLEKGR